MCGYGSFHRVTNGSISSFPLSGHLESLYEAVIRYFTGEMQYMVRTVARPGTHQIVLFLFQGSAPVFCNKSFVPHRCLSPHCFVFAPVIIPVVPGQGSLRESSFQPLSSRFKDFPGRFFSGYSLKGRRKEWGMTGNPVSAGSLIPADADRVPLVKSIVPADDNYQVNGGCW
jgi:hypothetical protein